MAASDFPDRAENQDPATPCGRRARCRSTVHLVALAGSLPMTWFVPTAADAQMQSAAVGASGAAAAIANRNAMPSQTIVRDPLTGRAIIIVGGRDHLGSLNPQPLPPDPPPDIRVRGAADLPAAPRRKPR